MITIDLLSPQPVLGENARKLRRSKHISVSEMARNTGYSRQAIYNFENGTAQSMTLLQEYLRLNEGGV